MGGQARTGCPPKPPHLQRSSTKRGPEGAKGVSPGRRPSFSSAASRALRLSGAGLAGRDAGVDRRRPPALVERVDALAVGPVPRRALASVAGRVLQPLLVEVDHVAADLGVVGQEAPGQGVVALAQTQEAAERHDRVGHLAGDLVDHEVVHRAETLALAIVDRRALDLVRGDQLVGLVGGDGAGAVRAGPGFGGDVLHRDLPVSDGGKGTGPGEGRFRGLPCWQAVATALSHNWAKMESLKRGSLAGLLVI